MLFLQGPTSTLPRVMNFLIALTRSVSFTLFTTCDVTQALIYEARERKVDCLVTFQ